MGVEDRKISDQQISASSHWNQHYGFNGRLNNEASADGSSGLTWGGWCTDQLDKNQYLQVSVSEKRPCYVNIVHRLIQESWTVQAGPVPRCPFLVASRLVPFLARPASSHARATCHQIKNEKETKRE